jgi:hypothetical protein
MSSMVGERGLILKAEEGRPVLLRPRRKKQAPPSFKNEKREV